MAVLFFLALAPKLAFIGLFGVPEPGPDATGYLQRAEVLLASGVFGMAPDRPDLSNAPGYSLFLVPFTALQGPRPFSALLAQCLLLSLAAPLVYLLARRLGGTAAGWFAGMVFCGYLPMVVYPARFVTEPLALFQFLLAMALMEALLVETRPGRLAAWGAAMGLLMAVTGLTRAVMFPYLLAPLGLAALRFVRRPGLALALIGAAALAFGAVYGPWVVRNQRLTGSAMALNEKKTPTVVNAHLVAGFIRGGMELTEAREATIRLRAEGDARGEVFEAPSRLSAVYWRDVSQRLAIMLALHPRVAARFPLSGTKVADRPLIVYANYAWHWVLLAGVLLAIAAGAARWGGRAPGLRLRIWATLLLPFALIALYCLVHAIPRYQIVPFGSLSVAAGIGFAFAWEKPRAKGTRSEESAAN
jgi:4-amino-4-deoxy-L-arabinose transferase-like glycosyltransferase